MDYSIGIIVAVGIFVLLFIIGLIVLISGRESGARRAGRKGEIIATQCINEILYEDDKLFTNVSVSFEGKKTEIDNIIINKRGIFIIEVKNYSGTLDGNEDDYEWKKSKVSGGGNLYQKTVRNPIRQVKRQIYILKHYLQQRGINVWIEGYVFLIENNSPVDSNYILRSQNDMHNVIHCGINNNLTDKAVNKIINLTIM